MIDEKTNTRSVGRFFLRIFKHIDDPLRTVIVLDNHTAHKSNKIGLMARNKGVKLLFTPPTDSELNPIEKMWSLFKRQWRNILLDPD
jgi:putative transposase